MQISRDSLTELSSGCSNNNSQSYCDSRRGSQLPSSGTRRRPARRLRSLPRWRLVPALLVRCHERSFPPSPISVRIEQRGWFWARLPSVPVRCGQRGSNLRSQFRASYPLDDAAGNSPFLVSVPRTPVEALRVLPPAAVPVRRRLRLVQFFSPVTSYPKLVGVVISAARWDSSAGWARTCLCSRAAAAPRPPRSSVA